VALAYPATTPELSSHVAKEAFIEALNEPQLQLKVMEREPKLVEDALNIATRLEAYEASLLPRVHDKGAADYRAKPKVKATYAVESEEQVTPAKEEKPASPETTDQRSQDRGLIESQLADLQKQCNSNRETLGRLKAQKDEAEKKAAQAAQAAKAAAEAAKTAHPPASTGSAPGYYGGNNNGNSNYRQQGNYRGRGRGRGNYRARGDDSCRKCGQMGHWARDCPNGPPPEQPAAPQLWQ